MAVYAGYLQAGSYTALQDRRLQSSKMNGTPPSGTTPLSGVISMGGNNNLAVAAATGFNITVEPGSAMVDQYNVVSDASIPLTVAPSTTSARRDLVILRVQDQEAGDASSAATIELVKGSTSADPTIPARSFVLAQIDIPASVASITSAMVVDRRTWAGRRHARLGHGARSARYSRLQHRIELPDSGGEPARRTGSQAAIDYRNLRRDHQSIRSILGELRGHPVDLDRRQHVHADHFRRERRALLVPGLLRGRPDGAGAEHDIPVHE